MRSFEITANGLQPPKDLKRRSASMERRVLVGDRRAKDRHDPIPGIALHDTSLIVHGVFHQLLQALHQA